MDAVRGRQFPIGNLPVGSPEPLAKGCLNSLPFGNLFSAALSLPDVKRDLMATPDLYKPLSLVQIKEMLSALKN